MDRLLLDAVMITSLTPQAPLPLRPQTEPAFDASCTLAHSYWAAAITDTHRGSKVGLCCSVPIRRGDAHEPNAAINNVPSTVVAECRTDIGGGLLPECLGGCTAWLCPGEAMASVPFEEVLECRIGIRSHPSRIGATGAE